MKHPVCLSIRVLLLTIKVSTPGALCIGLFRYASLVCFYIYIPHREVHWESANEVAQEYVERPELPGGEEEGEEQEETGVQGLAFLTTGGHVVFLFLALSLSVTCSLYPLFNLLLNIIML